MNKKFLTVAFALLLSACIAGEAAARDGFYLGIRGGLTNSNMNYKDDKASDTAPIDFDDEWWISGALGYRYSYVRLEFEYTYHDDHEEDLTEFGYENYMVNAYFDFLPNYVVSPYIQGGLGYTKLNLKTTTIIGMNRLVDESDETNFTWSLGAGLTLRLNKCLNLDVGYRYLDMGDIEGANINAHEWYGGLRFTF